MKRAIAVVCLVLAACAGGDERVTGTVVAVEGDLTTVSAFSVQTDRGLMVFVPADDLTGFVDGTSLTHLRDHLRDGHPVRVTFRVEDGVNVAIAVEDG